MEQKNQLTEEQLNTLREELVGVRGGGRGMGRREGGGEEGEGCVERRREG